MKVFLYQMVIKNARLLTLDDLNISMSALKSRAK